MKKPLIYCGIIICVTLICYWFSFTQLLKSETYFFFWRTQVIDNIQWYQFFLAPSGFAPGDTWLFRPLTYLLDALRQAWFGTNYTLWHITSVSLHILACLALLRLLWRIKPNLLALFGALLFATTPVLAGAVLYEDINGYQVFTALMLASFYYAYNFVDSRKSKDLIWCAITIFISGFFYELGLVVSVFLAFYIWCVTRDKKVIWYCSVIVVYAIIFAINALNNQMATIEGSRLLDPTNLLNGLNNFYVIALRWFCEISLPMAFYFIPLPQVKFQPLATGDHFVLWIVCINLLFLAMIVYAILSDKTKKNKMVFVFGALVIIYILIISLVRSSILGEGYVTSTNFDTYMLMALIVPLLYLLFCNTSKLGYKLALIGMACFIIIGGYRVSTANYQLSELEKPQKEYLAQVDQFVLDHKNEVDFTFKSHAGDYENNLTMSFMYQEKLQPFSVPQIVYYKYWSDDPKYQLEYVDGELLIR